MDNAQLLGTIRAEMGLLREKVERLKGFSDQKDAFMAFEAEIERLGYAVMDPFDISVWTPKIAACDVFVKLGILNAMKDEEESLWLEHYWLPPDYEQPEKPYCPKCAGEEEPFKGTEIYFVHGDTVTLYKSVDFNIATVSSEIDTFRKELVEIKASCR